MHAQEIAMFSYLTGSLDYALSNRIFISERIMRFVAEYIMQSDVHRELVKDLSFVVAPFFPFVSLSSFLSLFSSYSLPPSVQFLLFFSVLSFDRKVGQLAARLQETKTVLRHAAMRRFREIRKAGANR